MTAYPGCAGLARSPFVLTEHISSFKTFLVPVPFPLVTTFETVGIYKKMAVA